MRKIADIHVFDDREFLRYLRRASAAVLAAGVVVAFLWCLLAAIMRARFGLPEHPFELGVALGALGDFLLGVEGGSSAPRASWWIGLVVAVVAATAAHELTHAFFFRQYAPPEARVSFGANWELGMVYASAEGVLYTRDQYLAIVMAPTIAVTLLVLGVGIGLKWPLWTLIVTFTHLSGCVGDWGYARAILRDPTITHCEDTSWGVAFYTDEPFLRPHVDDAAATSGRRRSGEAPAHGFSVVDGGRDA